MVVNDYLSHLIFLPKFVALPNSPKKLGFQNLVLTRYERETNNSVLDCNLAISSCLRRYHMKVLHGRGERE